MSAETFGIEEVRKLVRVFDACNETFNMRFTAEELVKLYRVHCLCEWDVYPDDWSADQVRAALESGAVPRFVETPRGLVPLTKHEAFRAGWASWVAWSDNDVPDAWCVSEELTRAFQRGWEDAADANAVNGERPTTRDAEEYVERAMGAS